MSVPEAEQISTVVDGGAKKAAPGVPEAEQISTVVDILGRDQGLEGSGG